jgi:hypothetical protein
VVLAFGRAETIVGRAGFDYADIVAREFPQDTELQRIARELQELQRKHEYKLAATRIAGEPDPRHISTSFAERQNWTVRTNLRRYTRLSNGFSRKLQNHAAAVALNYFAYNFIKIHRTLRMSPAMAAGVSNRLWEVSDLVALWESYEREEERAA